MVMRHKPILPRQNEPMPAGKQRRAGEHHVMLSFEQRQALAKWQKDFKHVLPSIMQAAAIEQRLFQEMLDAPTWQIAETERPEHIQEDPKPWTVGHAQVNEVDKIDGMERFLK